jgi:two-component system NarL family response regulator
MRNREVGQLLDVSEQTIKNHLSSILHKLGVPNRTHAVTFAMRQGWLSLDEMSADEMRAVTFEPLPVATAPVDRD